VAALGVWMEDADVFAEGICGVFDEVGGVGTGRADSEVRKCRRDEGRSVVVGWDQIILLLSF
jgi:hypothetical protein